MRRQTRYPNTRARWCEYYGDIFNKTGHEQAATLALWYLFLHLAFGER